VKLLFPVTGVIFLSGMCCCGDFLQQAGVDIPMPDDATEGTEATAEAPAETTGSGGGSVSALGGTCGRYKDWGIGAPEGWSASACSDDGTNGGLVLMGGSDPAAGCKAVKGWAEGKGFKTTMDTEMSGTTAVILEKDSTQMTLGCTSMGGQNTISIALSPK
jgi:hypothetical protein